MRGSILLACALAACTSGSKAAGVDAGAGADGPMRVDASDLPTADELRAAIATCTTAVGGTFATDTGGTSNISICGLPTAVFWKADLDVDCDGKMSAQCSLATDPAYQNQTSATDSHGDPLDAATLPYVVVPSKSGKFDYATAGLDLGSVVAVIYGARVAYGVIGDTGPTPIIGEASYAMAVALGIDPDPSTGGTDTGVAYIAFTGSDAQVQVIEDHAEAVTVGVAHAKALLGR